MQNLGQMLILVQGRFHCSLKSHRSRMLAQGSEQGLVLTSEPQIACVTRSKTLNSPRYQLGMITLPLFHLLFCLVDRKNKFFGPLSFYAFEE